MFEPIDEFLNEGIDLPYGGKVYRIPPASARDGLVCQRAMAAANEITRAQREGRALTADELAKLQMSDRDQLDMYQRLLGATWQQLLDDDVPWPVIEHMGTTAYVWAGVSKEVAEDYWRSPVPKEPARKTPQDRKPRKTSSRTAGAATAKQARQGSNAGTTRKAAARKTTQPAPE